MYVRSARVRRFVVAASIATLGALYGFGAVPSGASPAADPGPGHGNGTFEVRQILSGTALHHSFTPAGTTVDMTEPLSDPDDITQLGGDLFVGFQNGGLPERGGTSGASELRRQPGQHRRRADPDRAPGGTVGRAWQDGRRHGRS
jgi:hypothetical protein